MTLRFTATLVVYAFRNKVGLKAEAVKSVTFVLKMMGHSRKAQKLDRRTGILLIRRWQLPLVLAAWALAAASLQAQQAATAEPPGQPAAVAQQPGNDAQVRTGTSSGLDADTRMQNLLADHQFIRLEQEIGELPPEQAQLYRGILANRANDTKKSIELLEPLIDKVSASGNTGQEKLLRKALAEDYLRLGDWNKAAQAYQTMEARLGAKLTSDEQDEIELPVKLLPLAKDSPHMTVEPCDPFVMQVEKNPLGLIDVPVFVDAQPHALMLDPTAPFNLLARSLAREVGLKVSEQAVTIHTLTGKPIQVHVAVIPRFTIAGRLTLRDVTVFVFEDKDYFFPINHYQVEGVLGYPAVSALGSLTITADDTVLVHPDKQLAADGKDDRLKNGARFFLDGDQVVVALGRVRQPGDPVLNTGEECMYVIDAGGQQTYLTSRYYDEHTSDFAGLKMQLFSVPGSGNLPPQPAYVAETVPLVVGATTVPVHYVQVLTQPLGSAALDDVYGVLGVDALDQLASYTFDYRTMRFSVKAR